MARNELADVDMLFQTTKGKGLCALDADNREVWLPLAEVEYVAKRETETIRRGTVIVVTMPQWLAEEKELV